MAWGLWNKIKKGFKKVGKTIKSTAKTINDNVIKPFKPIVKASVAAAGNYFVPGIGSTIASKVDDFSDGIDAATSGNAKQWINERVQRGYR